MQLRQRSALHWHATRTVPSASEMRDEAVGAVAQRATVPRECESEIEHWQMGFSHLRMIPTTRLEPLLSFSQAAVG